jgi:hypothetical protein
MTTTTITTTDLRERRNLGMTTRRLTAIVSVCQDLPDHPEKTDIPDSLDRLDP